MKNENSLRYVKLLPLQGARLTPKKPGRCPGLRASAPSGRTAMGFKVALAAQFLLFVLIQNSRNESQIAFPFGQRTLFLKFSNS